MVLSTHIGRLEKLRHLAFVGKLLRSEIKEQEISNIECAYRKIGEIATFGLCRQIALQGPQSADVVIECLVLL